MRAEEQSEKLKRIRVGISKLLKRKGKEKNLKPTELADIVQTKTVRIEKYGYVIKNLDVALFFLICETLEISFDEIYKSIYGE